MGAQAPVVRKMDSAIHCINHYPLDSAIGFRYTYRMDSDLSDGYSAIHVLNYRGQKNSWDVQEGYGRL